MGETCETMDISYWFSLSFAHYSTLKRRRTVNVYKKIDGTEFNSNIMSDDGSKPRFYDIVLVAKGYAEYVRSFKLSSFSYHDDRKPIFTMADQEVCCAICLEDTWIDEYACQLRCKHHFHQSCIFEWYLLNDTCPCCRADVERVDADLDVKKDVGLKRVDAEVDMNRISAKMKLKKIDVELQLMQMIQDGAITFEQYLQIKNKTRV